MKTDRVPTAIALKGWLYTTFIAFLVFAGSALAQSTEGTGSGGMNLLAKFFIAFFAAIIILQLIPALVLFASLISAVFGRATKKTGMVDHDLAGSSEH